MRYILGFYLINLDLFLHDTSGRSNWSYKRLVDRWIPNIEFRLWISATILRLQGLLGALSGVTSCVSASREQTSCFRTNGSSITRRSIFKSFLSVSRSLLCSCLISIIFSFLRFDLLFDLSDLTFRTLNCIFISSSFFVKRWFFKTLKCGKGFFIRIGVWLWVVNYARHVKFQWFDDTAMSSLRIYTWSFSWARFVLIFIVF